MKKIVLAIIMIAALSACRKDGTNCKCTYLSHGQRITYYEDVSEFGLNCATYQSSLNLDGVKCYNK